MTPLLSALVQASWQGAVFAVLVGTVCVLRLSASVRAFLWLLVGVKFVGVFLWLLCFGERAAVGIGNLPPLTMRVPSTFAVFFGAVWAVGAGVCALLILLRVYLAYRRVRRADAVSPVAQNLVATLTAFPIPSMRVVAPGESPQVTLWGGKPVVLLPAHLLPPSPDALAAPDLRLLLAHEIAHIRRGDLWAGWVFALMQTLFFFHPCAAWAKHEWEIAREEACDLFALRAVGANDDTVAARYGALLLALGGASRGRTGEQSTTGAAFLAASPFAALRRRLRHLEHLQGGQTPLARCGAAFLLLLFGALLTPLRPISTVSPRFAFVPAAPVRVAQASVSSSRTRLRPRPATTVRPRPTPPVSRRVAARPMRQQARVTAPRRPRLLPTNEPRTDAAPMLAANTPAIVALGDTAPPAPAMVPIAAEPDAPAEPTPVLPDVASHPTPDTFPIASGEVSSAPVVMNARAGTATVNTSRASGAEPLPAFPSQEPQPTTTQGGKVETALPRPR